MSRRLTPLVAAYARIAREMRLSCPLGRAVYAANRVYNGGGWPALYAFSDPIICQTAGDCLRSVQTATARRWLAHWRADGAIKALRYTREEWAKIRHERERGEDGLTADERRRKKFVDSGENLEWKLPLARVE